MPTAKTKPARLWQKTILRCLALLWLLSMTGCSHYVVVPGGETITISVLQWDYMRQDNELLMKGLQQCLDKQ